MVLRQPFPPLHMNPLLGSIKVRVNLLDRVRKSFPLTHQFPEHALLGFYDIPLIELVVLLNNFVQEQLL